MSANETPTGSGTSLAARLAAAQGVLLAGAIVLAGAVVAGGLSVAVALLIGAGLLVGALIPARRRPVARALARFGTAETTLSAPAPVDSRLGALVQALPEAALLLDPRGTVLVANAEAARTVASVRVGDPVSFAVRVPEVLEAVRSASADGEPRRVEFAERVPLDRWLQASVVPIRFGPAGERRKPDATLLVLRDLTQQRRVEQMRVDFIANASHELRTPLASLSGFIETLQGPARNDTPARERFLKIMGEQARRMSRLIDDLLSLSRIEMTAHMRPEAEVDLVAVVNHVRDALAPLALERGVAIAFVPPAGPVMARGDRDELIRVFENLVENALKYGGAGEEVTVTLVRDGGEAIVGVRDYGPGIAPEHLPRLTERFYRVDTAHSREQGGTGLGLAIVKHIVARHRGRLVIESRPGEGATFSVRLSARFPKDEKTEVSSAA
ncbi:ATP-binding protein [Ancylobacter sp. 6x-1]|uniref:histidine kinase n=1 Tax=Ancylobacter crimeensis TaxID=2579147 RepID=A0ABT0DDH2_9HYPH|nr:ATP-binding protein [Ancylobacter crimeensis]MCK0197992.1 ATP-binding protein [Ancylobacter crimeensis]